jgi:hypothetical protein
MIRTNDPSICVYRNVGGCAPDAIGMAVDPDPDDFKAWLFERCRAASSTTLGLRILLHSPPVNQRRGCSFPGEIRHETHSKRLIAERCHYCESTRLADGGAIRRRRTAHTVQDPRDISA